MKSMLNGFLEKAKGSLDPGKKTVIVIGNEAADLDSMASAVLYAYFLTEKNPSGMFIPLIGIPPEDFKLRTEAVFLFGEAGIDPGNLISVNDVDLETIHKNGNLEIILTDHNRITPALEKYRDTVIEILDHHADEKDYPPGVKTDIRPVGSACTIVAERYLSEAPGLIDGSTGVLLLGTILLDTVNLDPEAGRVTDADEKAAALLLEKTGIDRDDLFEKLQYEKFNVSSLGSYDLLRKDYKEWVLGGKKCGIGSVLMSASDWVEKDPDLPDAFEEFRRDRGLDILISMNAFTDPEFTRHLIVYVPDDKLRTSLTGFLENSEADLERMDFPGLNGREKIDIYNQRNLGISRKKLQPMLKSFLESLSGI